MGRKDLKELMVSEEHHMVLGAAEEHRKVLGQDVPGLSEQLLLVSEGRQQYCRHLCFCHV